RARAGETTEASATAHLAGVVSRAPPRPPPSFLPPRPMPLHKPPPQLFKPPRHPLDIRRHRLRHQSLCRLSLQHGQLVFVDVPLRDVNDPHPCSQRMAFRDPFARTRQCPPRIIDLSLPDIAAKPAAPTFLGMRPN